MCRECGCEEDYHIDDCGCGCGARHHGHRRLHVRRFLTKEEKIEKLESYAEELKKELSGVQERIRELRSK